MGHLEAEDLLDELRGAGLRITGPRRAICAVLAESHDDHLNALDLQARAEELAGARIDPSTVYRTIDALESAGALHHIHLAHGPAVVHLTDHVDHHHLVCDECGRTIDLPLSELEGLTARLEAKYGFRADSVHFALVGRCVEHAKRNEV